MREETSAARTRDHSDRRSVSHNFDRRRSDAVDGSPSPERRRSRDNRLLRGLPGPAREILARHLELVPMPAGLVLWKKGDVVTHFIFPIDCVVSLSIEMAAGTQVDVAAIGNEGVVDVITLFGNDLAARQASVELPGFAYRMPVRPLIQAFAADTAIQLHFMHYIRALFMHMAQINACGHRHSIEQQLCSLLLCILDRTRSKTIATTHERLAGMLGVRREGVTEELGRLKSEELVGGKRGSLLVLNRDGLEKRCCECYGLVRDEYDLLRLPKTYASGEGTVADVGNSEDSRATLDTSARGSKPSRMSGC